MQAEGVQEVRELKLVAGSGSVSHIVERVAWNACLQQSAAGIGKR